MSGKTREIQPKTPVKTPLIPQTDEEVRRKWIETRKNADVAHMPRDPFIKKTGHKEGQHRIQDGDESIDIDD